MLIGRESLQASLKLLISLHVLFYFLSRWQVTCDDGQAFQYPNAIRQFHLVVAILRICIRPLCISPLAEYTATARVNRFHTPLRVEWTSEEW